MINYRLNLWESGKYDMLTQDTDRAALAKLARVQGGKTQEQWSTKFAKLVLQGKLRMAVRWITEGEKGGFLLPNEVDAKTGEYVIDVVLKSKHPDARILDASKLEDYEETPDFVDLDITEEVVKQIARRLFGSAGPGGSDAQSIQHWLLRFGTASQVL
jgi:hypothetical protein